MVCHSKSYHWQIERLIRAMCKPVYIYYVTAAWSPHRDSGKPASSTPAHLWDIDLIVDCCYRACGLCPFVRADCYNPQCVTADGYERSILTVNRRLPAPSIQVRSPLVWVVSTVVEVSDKVRKVACVSKLWKRPCVYMPSYVTVLQRFTRHTA